MQIKKINVVYFSPTKNTEKVVKRVAEVIANIFDVEIIYIDYTDEKIRNHIYKFEDDELLIYGSCVYAGRIPNKLLPFLQNNIKGNKTLCIPIVTYGNRSFDQALKEAQQELQKNSCITVAAAAIPAQHAFTNALATSRPTNKDMHEIENFAKKVAIKIRKLNRLNIKINLPGDEEITKYYIPLKEDGTPAKFLKAKPKTDSTKCCNCGICATVCPMQSISYQNVSEIHGICIKCQACIHQCPTQAKYFDDKEFLSHVKMLEKNYKEKKENLFWV